MPLFKIELKKTVTLYTTYDVLADTPAQAIRMAKEWAVDADAYTTRHGKWLLARKPEPVEEVKRDETAVR